MSGVKGGDSDGSNGDSGDGNNGNGSECDGSSDTRTKTNKNAKRYDAHESVLTTHDYVDDWFGIGSAEGDLLTVV